MGKKGKKMGKKMGHKAAHKTWKHGVVVTQTSRIGGAIIDGIPTRERIAVGFQR